MFIENKFGRSKQHRKHILCSFFILSSMLKCDSYILLNRYSLVLTIYELTRKYAFYYVTLGSLKLHKVFEISKICNAIHRDRFFSSLVSV